MGVARHRSAVEPWRGGCSVTDGNGDDRDSKRINASGALLNYAHADLRQNMSTRPPALTPEDIETIRRFGQQGARITMHDPRVTSLNTWLVGIVGTSVVFFLGWNIQSIQTLNETLAVMREESKYRGEQLKELRETAVRSDRADRMERHIESVDGRVTTLEKRTR